MRPSAAQIVLKSRQPSDERNYLTIAPNVLISRVRGGRRSLTIATKAGRRVRPPEFRALAFSFSLVAET
jgi:hypothetical protein